VVILPIKRRWTRWSKSVVNPCIPCGPLRDPKVPKVTATRDHGIGRAAGTRVEKRRHRRCLASAPSRHIPSASGGERREDQCFLDCLFWIMLIESYCLPNEEFISHAPYLFVQCIATIECTTSAPEEGLSRKKDRSSYIPHFLPHCICRTILFPTGIRGQCVDITSTIDIS